MSTFLESKKGVIRVNDALLPQFLSFDYVFLLSPVPNLHPDSVLCLFPYCPVLLPRKIIKKAFIQARSYSPGHAS